MEERIKNAERFSKIWWQSRADVGKSQEYMAMGLGVSKKTIQNWEKGVSSPSFFQGAEWFRILGVNPMRYYLEFVYPPNKNEDEYDYVQKNFDDLINQIPPDCKEAIWYLFCGKHGSSAYGMLQMMLAHLHAPMKERVSHASAAVHDYELAKEMGALMDSDSIQPDIELLKKAVDAGKQAVLNNQEGYVIKDSYRI